MKNTLKNRIIAIFEKNFISFRDSDIDKGETANRILAELQKETKQAIEKVRLEEKTPYHFNKDPKLIGQTMKIGATLGYNKAIVDLEKKKKQVIKEI